MNVRRVAALAVTGLVAAISLSGCMRGDVTMEINSEGQITAANMEIGVQKDVLNQIASLGTGQPATLDTFKQQMAGQVQGVDEKSCQYQETSTEFVANCAVSPSDLALFNGQVNKGNGMSITVADDVITVNYDNTATSGQFQTAPAAPATTTTTAPDGTINSTTTTTMGAPSPMASGQPGGTMNQALGNMMSGITFHMNLVFPGNVQSVSGQGVAIDSGAANVAVIDLTKAQKVTITASTGNDNSAMTYGILAFLGVFGALAILYFAAVQVRRDKEEKAAAAAAADEPVKTKVPVEPEADAADTAADAGVTATPEVVEAEPVVETPEPNEEPRPE